MTTRKEAMKHFKRTWGLIRGKDTFTEDKSDRLVYVCVIHNSNTDNTEIEKRMTRAIMRGQKVTTAKGEATVHYGCGKLLGVIRFFNGHRKKYENQLVLYDFDVLIGKERPSRYCIYHEAWSKFAEWFQKEGLDKLPEKIVFS